MAQRSARARFAPRISRSDSRSSARLATQLFDRDFGHFAARQFLLARHLEFIWVEVLNPISPLRTASCRPGPLGSRLIRSGSS